MNTRCRNVHALPWRRSLTAAAAAALVAGCASTPRLFVDRADGPIACESFAWLETPEQTASITEQRLRAEILQALADKAYATDAESPDCLVSGAIFTDARPASPVSVGLGAGRWGGRFGGGVGVNVPVRGSAQTVGSLAIDIVDAGLDAEIWRATLEAAFRTPEPDADQIGTAVREALEEFPDRHTD